MIIRYFLALQTRSAAAYVEIRSDEKTGAGLVVFRVKEDFEMIKVISNQNKVLTMK